MVDLPARSAELRAALKSATTARVALGRAGQGLPTAPMLAFQLAHARAADAVHAPLDVEKVRSAIAAPSFVVDSAAPDRLTYLQNPELGRRLSPQAPPLPCGSYDVALVVGDGLSAAAVHAHAPALVQALLARLAGWRLAPIIVARQARVALGDPIGESLGARAVIVLLGERPGLSAPDSLGAYLTWDPKTGRRDHERNCVSNIHTPHGLTPDQAASKIYWLLSEARRLGFTGVRLKDRQSTTDNHPPQIGGSSPLQ